MALSRDRFLAAAVAVVCGCLVYANTSAADQAKEDKESRPIRILALGDSLTAGYGLDDLADSFPSQLERALEADGYNVDLINAGISGDTSTGGLTRLEWSLAEKPDAVIVSLGANDGLRAIDPAVTEKSLAGIVERLQRDGIPVLLTGMLAPPNLGRDYGERFNAMYPALAKKFDVLLYPFFLEGVAAVPALNQADRIHPNPKGVALMVEKILPSVEKLIAQVHDRRGQ
ncbi:MAG: arylesterase [Rhodospirillaceae bacterium]|nr:arylesterase [Rhodospirillaceae bacterium]